MAQLVEQRIRNAWVAGSSPARGSFCEISTSVVHGLPKPGRRVRFPYLAQTYKKKALDSELTLMLSLFLIMMFRVFTFQNFVNFNLTVLFLKIMV